MDLTPTRHQKRRIDNYSLKTYISRDYEANSLEDGTQTANNSSGDFGNIAILVMLYTIQGSTFIFLSFLSKISLGIPMGLSGSVPMLMKERGASYSSLSVFSMVSIPFSLKLLWAPIVDSVYIRKVGRRKTWLVST